MDRNDPALRRYPDTTGLQAWLVVVASLIETARGQLSQREFECFFDIVTRRVVRENARQRPRTDEWLQDTMRRAA